MKKFLILGFMSLLILLLTNNVFGSDLEYDSIAIGLGIPYGNSLGINVEKNFTDFFTILMGCGLSEQDQNKDEQLFYVGLDIGGRVYLANKKSKFRPYLGFYYSNIPNQDDQAKPNSTFGGSRSLGIELTVYEFHKNSKPIYIDHIKLDAEVLEVFNSNIWPTKLYALGVKIYVK